MKGIVWLASYPKSGNTWLRAFLTNFRNDRDKPADINSLLGGGLFVRDSFDAALGWETSDLPAEAIEDFRAPVQSVVADEAGVILKTHDAYADPRTGGQLISPAATMAAVYLIRNPLDVAVSLANHYGKSLDEAISRLNDEDYFLGRGAGMAFTLRQPTGNWSWHVTSWMRASGFRRHVLRYEDMIHDPGRAFADLCGFLQLPEDAARIERAVRNSAFGILREQEGERGFREAPPKNRRFFHGGTVGAWRHHLSEAQVAAIVRVHGEVMRQFGYLNSNGPSSN